MVFGKTDLRNAGPDLHTQRDRLKLIPELLVLLTHPSVEILATVGVLVRM